jgi:hypothetical protein
MLAREIALVQNMDQLVQLLVSAEEKLACAPPVTQEPHTTPSREPESEAHSSESESEAHSSASTQDSDYLSSCATNCTAPTSTGVPAAVPIPRPITNMDLGADQQPAVASPKPPAHQDQSCDFHTRQPVSEERKSSTSTPRRKLRLQPLRSAVFSQMTVAV